MIYKRMHRTQKSCYTQNSSKEITKISKEKRDMGESKGNQAKISRGHPLLVRMHFILSEMMYGYMGKVLSIRKGHLSFVIQGFYWGQSCSNSGLNVQLQPPDLRPPEVNSIKHDPGPQTYRNRFFTSHIVNINYPVPLIQHDTTDIFPLFLWTLQPSEGLTKMKPMRGNSLVECVE